NQLECLGDPLGRGGTADVEEVGRVAAVQLDQIHGAHGQTGTVDHAADVAIQRDVGQIELLSSRFAFILLAGIVHGGIFLVPKQCIVVEIKLAIESNQPALFR